MPIFPAINYSNKSVFDGIMMDIYGLNAPKNSQTNSDKIKNQDFLLCVL
ncbi:hypothetical protein H1P_1290009 [Hyella patelloides LEGE 07179]|uniref:Uncharacterized protein n=1 Tax=Hyella patelloides LEGE 07179 TaxID=945734 RepID=A0A563VKK4_9CYAN|nr:hypothetical protein H1P_1290009 [Hyella patelloides LEGE 07179]